MNRRNKQHLLYRHTSERVEQLHFIGEQPLSCSYKVFIRRFNFLGFMQGFLSRAGAQYPTHASKRIGGVFVTCVSGDMCGANLTCPFWFTKENCAFLYRH
jgi:hypothetical protein